VRLLSREPVAKPMAGVVRSRKVHREEEKEWHGEMKL
jgi:hypothetical protein